MLRLLLPLLLPLLLSFVALAQEAAPQTAALDKLDQLVTQLVADDDIVGAELMIVQRGETLLHRAYGWSDRESERAMELNSVFCVRSMTKPLVGVAVMMLVEEGKIELSRPAYEYLPELDHEGLRQITVHHLLHHLGGFPMTHITMTDLPELTSTRQIAAMSAEHDLIFPPGTKMRYSDHGTDTLTGLVEAVSGQSAQSFVEERILQPLGMTESVLVFPEDHPLRKRTASKYVGAQGSWTRYWSPEDDRLFPLFLGSQSMHSTLADYRRFAEFWLNHARMGEQALLSPESVQAVLTPGPYPMGGPSGLPEARNEYGKLMQLWTVAAEEGGRKNLAFGHTGSDGTHCWIFPEQDAIALYFTQSRGTLSGLQVEAALGELFLGVEVEAPLEADSIEDYLGYYSEGGNDRYRAIVRHDGGLALEILGKGVFELVYDGDDQWHLALEPTSILGFQRDAQGMVTGYKIGDHEEFRFTPAAELPSGAALAARVAEVHGWSKLTELGPLRMTSELSMPAAGITGKLVTTYVWPNRFRMDASFGPEFEYIAYDGEIVSYHSVREAAGPVQDAERAERLRNDHYLARLGDWTQWFDTIDVVQQVMLGNREMYLVRTGDCDAPARTFYVEVATGRVLGEDSLSILPGMGPLGQKIRFDDYREVEGMLVPYRTRIEFSNRMLGRMTVLVQEAEVGVEAPAFRLRPEASGG